MMKFIENVKEFQDQFEIGYDGPVRYLPPELDALRIARLQEELDEYVEAATLEAKLDALVDLIYVAAGAIDLHGFEHVFELAWDRVHAANLRKVRAYHASDSRHGSTFDIVKPVGWEPPDLSDLVARRCSACGTDGEGRYQCGECGADVCGGCLAPDEFEVDVCPSCAERGSS